MPEPKVAVIGLGATGTAVLWRLARRGVPAVGIEQFEPGHERGSSHGPTRIIRLAHFENAAYVPLMRRSYDLWRELEAGAGAKLLHITGLAEIGPRDGEIVQGTLAAASRHDLDLEILEAGALMRRYPAFTLPRDFLAVLQPDGGYIEASRALKTGARMAAAAGAETRSGEKVLAVEPAGSGVRVVTRGGARRADFAVIAAGPWLPSLLPELPLPLRVTRQVVGWFEPDDATRFAPDRFPVFILESRHGSHYGLPVYGANGIKIAKHHHLDESVTPDTCDRTVSPRDEAAIRAPLAEFLPGANGRLLRAETCLYTMTPDATFIIDRVPGLPQIIVASPCSGHGFKFAPVIGDIVADLITRGDTPHDIGQFRLQRFAHNGRDASRPMEPPPR